MTKEKLKGHMNTVEIATIMSEGNQVTLQIVNQMLMSTRGIIYLLLCDKLGIRGSKLDTLYNDCCYRDMNIFGKTLEMLKQGVYTEDEIEKNLSLYKSVPFVYDNVFDNQELHGINYGPEDEMWFEYCSKNREKFLKI